MNRNRIFVTGGAGFIGSSVIRQLINKTDYSVTNIDVLTYSGNQSTNESVVDNDRYNFQKIDILDREGIYTLFDKYQPGAIIHLAAETHVDRSIDNPGKFIQTNINGTASLLTASVDYLSSKANAEREAFRFLHVSTDEVFGSLGVKGLFNESSAYNPRSPYAASKASSDHLVRAWYYTYQLPIIVTNCSNNYGPYQYPEKLIPLTIIKALRDEAIPVYGNGENVRDWIYVDDHARALISVLKKGKVGETYNIGGECEIRNIEVAKKICNILDRLSPRLDNQSYNKKISFVPDRPGHDYRYAMNINKITNELCWKNKEDFNSGIEKTIKWYLDNREWWESAFIKGQYNGKRLGLISNQN